ncbi:transcriptional regulator [Paenibacillus sp. J31TS4]|uniref:PucR family transcriptional regulator n=1 Tax=Paenibacillus sp. J31TS4 TaxID=2807195 RepID=UPI001B185581|nr:PucR family transcriptional regulator [Paenibacillus sp. J31TS4]GIP37827.1 transcriptional regulator [Paenibacillus sp. J31TS4]
MKWKGVTVRELLKLPVLKEAKVISGEEGLDRVVRYVDILEVPDLRGWLREGELVLTTGYSVRHDPDLLAALVEQLAQVDGAAVAIKTERFIADVPPSMLEKSREHGIPVLQLPNDLPYIDITYPIMEQIIDKQAALLRRSEEVYKTLMNLLLTSSGLQAVADTVAGLVQAPVWVVDKHGELLAGTAADGPGQEESVLSYDIAVDKQTVGRLLIGKESLDELELVCVEQARLVFSLEFMGRKIAEDTEARLRGSFFEEVLAGLPFSRQEVESKGRQFGLRPEWSWEVWLLEADAAILAPGTPFSAELEEALALEAARRRVKAHAMRQGERLVLMLAVDDARSDAGRGTAGPADAGSAWTAVLEPILAPWKQVRAGIGSRRPLWEASRGYTEARRALALGSRLDKRRQLLPYDDVEIFQLLLEAAESVNFEPLIDKKIGKLAAYDRENGTELVTTLYYYLATGGSLYETANRLFIHRNSVKYRMDRIREIAGVEFDSPLKGINYYLCTAFYLLKIME